VSVSVALVAPGGGVRVGVSVNSGVKDGNVSGVSVAAIVAADVGVGVATPISIVIGWQAARAMMAQRVKAIKFHRCDFVGCISILRWGIISFE